MSAPLPDTIVVTKGITMTFLRDEPFLTRAHISGDPDADVLHVPFHWHETHDEIIRVLEGQLQVTVGSTVHIVRPEDGELLIPKGTIHELKSFKGIKSVIEERTDPMDDEKELFFRNIFPEGKALPTNILYFLNVCYHGDAVLVLPGHIKWLEKKFTTLFGYYIAPVFGKTRKYTSLKQAN